MERWLPIAGYEGHYEVSDLGRVRSLDRIVTVRNGRDRLERGRILRTIGDETYSQVALHLNKVRTNPMVHRLMMDAFVGPCPDGMECRHLNGNGRDNRLENLRWGTKLENAADKHLHGTMFRGERHTHAKLTVAAAREIRAEYAPGVVRQVDLAAKYGVSQVAISLVLRNKTWREAA